MDHRIDEPACAARIGGDEFAVILPGTEHAEGEAMMKVILDLVAINNEFYTDLPLSLSMGLATSEPGDRLESVVTRADLAMLKAKREHYTREQAERRALAASWSPVAREAEEAPVDELRRRLAQHLSSQPAFVGVALHSHAAARLDATRSAAVSR